jgi:hypothetical protein
MANRYEPSDDEVSSYDAWTAKAPPAVAALAATYKPWKLYRLKPTGTRVYVYSFLEGKTTGNVRLKVAVSGQYNYIPFECFVGDVQPEDLEECDLPPADEKVGVALSLDEAGCDKIAEAFETFAETRKSLAEDDRNGVRLTKDEIARLRQLLADPETKRVRGVERCDE